MPSVSISEITSPHSSTVSGKPNFLPRTLNLKKSERKQSKQVQNAYLNRIDESTAVRIEILEHITHNFLLLPGSKIGLECRHKKRGNSNEEVSHYLISMSECERKKTSAEKAFQAAMRTFCFFVWFVGFFLVPDGKKANSLVGSVFLMSCCGCIPRCHALHREEQLLLTGCTSNTVVNGAGWKCVGCCYKGER